MAGRRDRRHHLEGDHRQTATSLFSLCAPCMIDQNLTHEPRGNCQEMTSASHAALSPCLHFDQETGDVSVVFILVVLEDRHRACSRYYARRPRGTWSSRT
jgi:hypothetical protein